MNKLILTIPTFSSFALIPTLLLSAKNDFENEEDKQQKYVICDYIKLTGKTNTEVAYKNNISGGIINKGKVYWFKDGGYSIIDIVSKKICEVNPNVNWNKIYFEKTLRYDGIGKFQVFYATRDKTISGDRKRPKKPDEKTIYDNFKYENYLNIKFAVDSEFKKYGINKMENGLLYADYEVPYSWWFKTSDYKNFGLNSSENTYNESDEEKFHYYKFFPTYYKYDYLQKSKGGICGYVANTMLFLYNEYFNGSEYFNNFEKNFILTDKYGYNFGENNIYNLIGNHISPKLDSNFLKYLYQKTWFSNGVSGWWYYKYISESFLYNKWKSSKINYSYWGDNEPTQESVWKTIVSYKTPTLLGGRYSVEYTNNKVGHVVVAYGAYNDGRYLCNFGWNKKYSQVVVAKDNYDYNDNFTIHYKKGGTLLNKYFNFENNFYSGTEIDTILKNKGYIK